MASIVTPPNGMTAPTLSGTYDSATIVSGSQLAWARRRP